MCLLLSNVLTLGSGRVLLGMTGRDYYLLQSEKLYLKKICVQG